MLFSLTVTNTADANAGDSYGYRIDQDWSWHSFSDLRGEAKVYQTLYDLLLAETNLTVFDLAGLSESEISNLADSIGIRYRRVRLNQGYQASNPQSSKLAQSNNNSTGFTGDFFSINQKASTSSGEVKRYINMSSPWSGAYLYEDMHVTGRVAVEENFSMYNLYPAKMIDTGWYFPL